MAALKRFDENTRMPRVLDDADKIPTSLIVIPASMGDDKFRTELEQIEFYLGSEIPLQRLVHVKKLAESCRRAGIDETRRLACPLLPRIFSDAEFVVRQALADELGPLTSFLHENEDATRSGYHHTCNVVIPLLTKLLVDQAAEVRTASTKTLVFLASLLDEDDMERQVLTPALVLAHEDHDEHRSTAVSLLHDLAPVLARDLCMSFIGHELVSMSEDPSFRVRKSTAAAFANVCVTVGNEYAVQRLLPAFLKLSKDAIWGVRKSCVDSLVGVAASMPVHIQSTIFVPMLDQFLKDISRWVRNGAYEVLGPFIAILRSDMVSPDFLSKFAQIPSLTNAVVDPDITYFCAFNFPAVVHAIGSERWSELGDTFAALVRDAKFRVRRTLAHSLHELAHLIGPDRTVLHLLPVWKTFFGDIDDVKVGVISFMSSFVQALPAASRHEFVDYSWLIQGEADQNWRFRKHLALQVGDLCELFSDQVVSDTFVRLTFALLHDRVATVRHAAVVSASRVFQRLWRATPSQTPLSEVVSNFLLELQSFALGKSFMDRQLFVKVAEVMWLGAQGPDASSSSPPVDSRALSSHVLPLLFSLASDKVSNVRLALARTLKIALQSPRLLSNESNESVLLSIEVLKKDSNADVAFYFDENSSGFSQEIDLHRHAEAVLNEAEFAPIPPQWVHMSAAAEPSKWGER